MTQQDPSWLPSPEQVVAVIARFFPDVNGAVDGGWSPTASPTKDQVADIVVTTGRTVAAQVAGGILAGQEPLATEAVRYLAAAEVVLAFFPEATRDNLDYVKTLRSWADSSLAKLGIADSGGTGGAGGVTPATPVGYYPQMPPLPTCW